MTFSTINSCKTLELVLLHEYSIKPVFCGCWVLFVWVSDKWVQPFPPLTAAPELWCYLQLFSRLLQLLLPLWPRGPQTPSWNLQHTHTYTHTQSVRNFTHIYSFVQQCSEANLHMYSCSCRHKTQKLLSALHIHTRMHSAGSQESSRFMQPALNNIRAEVGRPWTEIWNSFCHKKQILINVYCTDRLQK